MNKLLLCFVLLVSIFLSMSFAIYLKDRDINAFCYDHQRDKIFMSAFEPHTDYPQEYITENSTKEQIKFATYCGDFSANYFLMFGAFAFGLAFPISMFIIIIINIRDTRKNENIN